MFGTVCPFPQEDRSTICFTILPGGLPLFRYHITFRIHYAFLRKRYQQNPKFYTAHKRT